MTSQFTLSLFYSLALLIIPVGIYKYRFDGAFKLSSMNFPLPRDLAHFFIPCITTGVILASIGALINWIATESPFEILYDISRAIISNNTRYIDGSAIFNISFTCFIGSYYASIYILAERVATLSKWKFFKYTNDEIEDVRKNRGRIYLKFFNSYHILKKIDCYAKFFIPSDLEALIDQWKYLIFANDLDGGKKPLEIDVLQINSLIYQGKLDTVMIGKDGNFMGLLLSEVSSGLLPDPPSDKKNSVDFKAIKGGLVFFGAEKIANINIRTPEPDVGDSINAKPFDENVASDKTKIFEFEQPS